MAAMAITVTIAATIFRGKANFFVIVGFLFGYIKDNPIVAWTRATSFNTGSDVFNYKISVRANNFKIKR